VLLDKKNQYQSIMADQIAISFQSSGVKSTPKEVSGNPGNQPPLKLTGFTVLQQSFGT